MSKLKIDKNSIQNSILKDGLFIFGLVISTNSSIISDASGSFAHGYIPNAYQAVIHATGLGAHAEGYIGTVDSIVASGDGSHAEGISTRTDGNGSHAEGVNTNILLYAFKIIGTFGNNTYVVNLSEYDNIISGKTFVYNNNCYQIISKTNSGGPSRISVSPAVITGYSLFPFNVSYGSEYASHAEGKGTRAFGKGSHAEGYSSQNGNIIAFGQGAHAEGCDVTYTGNASIFASGDGSHAEGFINSYNGCSGSIFASGDGSHAEGYASATSTIECAIKSEGPGSHAEGYAGSVSSVIYNLNVSDSSCIDASGYGAHAEGILSLAISHGAHAEGIQTIASGPGSHTSGRGTIANLLYQFVCGKWNTTNNDALFIVGNGTAKNSSSNAFWVNNDGTAHSKNGFHDESDIRKKDIISEISLEKSYELLEKSQEIIYTFKDDKERKEQLGMIALEVEEYFPEIVSTDSDGYKSLNYARLSVICLRLLKDMNLKYKSLENDIEYLKNKIK